MNRAVYHQFFTTYGRRPGFWVGIATEITSSLLLRVWIVVIMAQIVGYLTKGELIAARQSTLLFLAVYVTGTIIGLVGEFIAMRSENNYYQGTSLRFSDKLTGKDMAFYRDHQAGYLVSLFRQHLNSFILLGRFIRVNAIRALISLLIPTIVLMYAELKLGLVALGVVAVQIVYVIWASARSNKYRTLTHEIYRKVTGEIADQITNIVAFKSSGARTTARRYILDLARQETQAYWLRRKASIILDLPRDLITAGGITMALLVILGGSTIQASAVALMVLSLTYMFQIMRTVGDLPDLMTQHDDLVTQAYPTLQYLSDKYETIRDPADPLDLVITHGTIRFRGVGFHYPAGDGRTIPIFDGLDLRIPGGQSVGIVGLSGAGKTTLANLIMRFDDVSSGAITIDEVDIRHITQDQLHQHIAYVPQEPLLFHRTVIENIAYFNEQAQKPDIIRAAQAAHAHEFITRLPDGYDSVVGERGVKLSGGQKQRIVIARAILKNAPIMLFDEATSALDSHSEKIIQSALPDIIGRHTAIVIAHRLSTVAGLDRIIVMDAGRIVEDGTHDELLALGGHYYRLWQRQTAH